jgi:hypothetical protein
VGLSGMQHVKAILATLECEGHILVLVDCPLCEEPQRMELDPAESTYFCGACGKRGRLEDLAVLAEGVFLHRHRGTRWLMETRPGRGWEREGGGRR